MLSSPSPKTGCGAYTAAVALISLCGCAPAAAQGTVQDLAVFLSVTNSHFSRIPDDRFSEFEFTPAVDLIYSRSAGRRRLMAEFLVNDIEQDLERFHFGWQLTEDTRVLLGRFHHSGTFWNTRYHHGAFLQTAITRPSIEEFEDLGGILPMHVTGVLLEQRETFDNGSALEISFSTGLTGQFEGNAIEPFNLLGPESGHEPAIIGRISFLPDTLGENQVGVFFGKHNLAISDSDPIDDFWDPTANEIELETFGIYGLWGRGRWRVFGAANSVSAVARGGIDGNNRDFVATYMQTEFDLNRKLSLLLRAENTTGDESYTEIFDYYVRRQGVAGVRWNVVEKHALTFELASGNSHGDDFERASVQWSFVFN